MIPATRLAVVLVVGACYVSSFAQQQKVRIARPPVFPNNMDCEKVDGDKEIPSNRDATILKRGTDFYLCHPKSDTLLSRAKTVAITVRSTQTISCGDGSSDDCLRDDIKTEKEIERIADATDIWRYFEQAPPAKADIIIHFTANNRASADARILLQAQDSDSGAWAYVESRAITDIENDVDKLIEHFIAKTDRTPFRSTEDLEKMRQCARLTDQIAALRSEYQKKRRDYDFKVGHPLDAQMEECNLHWRDWVCLKRGGTDGMVSYAKEWNESNQELQRKMSLEYHELKDLDEQITDLSKSTCSP